MGRRYKPAPSVRTVKRYGRAASPRVTQAPAPWPSELFTQHAATAVAEGRHAHREAFCLMQYESHDGSERLVVWNSRDGVTPFGCSHPVTGTELRHVRWGEDIYAPDHRPAVGDWVWGEQNPEDEFRKALAFVERWWADPQMPMREHPHYNPDGADGEEAIRRAAFVHVKATLDSEHAVPALLQATEPWLEALPTPAPPSVGDAP